jgi:hypothetical protein
MGANFHTPWVDKPTYGYTVYTAASMNPNLASLDRGLTYLKNIMVGYGGTISWATGTLTWSSEIEIRFNTAAGLSIRNYIAAGNIALADDEYAYVDLSETDDTLLTVSKATIPDNAASTFIAYNRLVLGYRESISDNFYPVALRFPMSTSALGDVVGPAGATEDNLPSFGDATGKVIEDSGLAIEDVDDAVENSHIQNTDQYLDYGGPNEVSVEQIVALLVSESDPAASRYLDGQEQEVICADNVTINWSLGGTAYMVMDRATAAITLSNGVNGRVYRLRIEQSVGEQGVTWVTPIKWGGGGTPPALTVTANYWDWITLVKSNNIWSGDKTLNFPS